MYNKILQIISERKKAVICLITETKGSTPRKIGSKMIVFENGEIEGSVGGGDLEFFVIQKAQEIIKTQIPKTFNFGLKADFQMACGGNVSIFVEPIKLPEHLIIFGAGHIGRALANLAINFGFNITVIDERDGIFDNWKQLSGKNIQNDQPETSNEQLVKFINKNHEEAFAELNFDNQTYVCAISHTHSYDMAIGGYCGAKETAYVGVIASKTKAAKIRKQLIIDKKLTEEQVDKLDMPMGIPIACETPKEIAVSILAKLIDVKNS